MTFLDIGYVDLSRSDLMRLAGCFNAIASRQRRLILPSFKFNRRVSDAAMIAKSAPCLKRHGYIQKVATRQKPVIL
jgi:hypothetical protein